MKGVDENDEDDYYKIELKFQKYITYLQDRNILH